MGRSVIQPHYVDALGRRHQPPAATMAAVRRAMGDEAQGEAAVVVARSGDQPALGPAELQLEDGTPRTVDRRLPSDLPPGTTGSRARDTRQQG